LGGNAQLFAQIMLGYDSNPAQTQTPAGAAFASYAAGIENERYIDGSAWGLSLNAWYRDYEGMGDSYRTNLLGSWSTETEDGLGRVTLSIEGNLYRDALVPADERNEAALALGWSRSLSARDDFTIETAVRWLAYRNESLPWQGRPGAATANRSPRGAEREGSLAAVRRTDRIASLDLHSAHYWTPTISTSVDLYLARRDSPVRLEAYRQLGAGLSLRLTPATDWQLDLALDGYGRQYDRAPRQLERNDKRLGAALVLRRKMDAGELSCGLETSHNRSNISTKSFRQWVSQCGSFWTF